MVTGIVRIVVCVRVVAGCVIGISTVWTMLVKAVFVLPPSNTMLPVAVPRLPSGFVILVLESITCG